MRKIFLKLFLLMAFAPSVFAQNHSLAKVQRANGFRVFTDCEPVCDYEVVGREKVSVSWSGQYLPIRNKLIKKAIKEAPDADGIILTFSTGGADRALIIKFKEGQRRDSLDLANVTKTNGMLVFTDCEPVCDYEIIEREKAVIGWSGQYQPVRNKLVRKAVNDVPDADGVVLTFSTGGIDRAAVIRFKE